MLARAYYANHQESAAAETVRRVLDLLPYQVLERDDTTILRHMSQLIGNQTRQ